MGLANSPGALSQVLAIFAANQVNLLLISSSTSGSSVGRSGFYLEVDGHASDARMVRTLVAVRGVANYCTVLGSFQKVESM